MTHRERFIACILGEPVDRPPLWLHWGPWKTTWRLWTERGEVPAEFEDFRAVRAQFDPDPGPAGLGLNCGPCPKRPETVIEEDADYVTWIEQVAAVGYEAIWYKQFSEEIVFAYLERPGDPLLIELLQMP